MSTSITDNNNNNEYLGYDIASTSAMKDLVLSSALLFLDDHDWHKKAQDSDIE